MSRHSQYIEDLNYYSDPRTRDNSPITTVEMYDNETDELVEIEVPTVWEICHMCSGNGTHVNPSIDCCGLTHEDFAEDPDFLDEYMSGTYDVQCRTCKGTGKVRVPDYDALTDEQREGLEELERDRAQWAAEEAAERAMGA